MSYQSHQYLTGGFFYCCQLPDNGKRRLSTVWQILKFLRE
ncbi:conserved hypothetical protein [Escherichia coli B171]|nr:conserved hypothetical protein [Escherichia coli B171]